MLARQLLALSSLPLLAACTGGSSSATPVLPVEPEVTLDVYEFQAQYQRYLSGGGHHLVGTQQESHTGLDANGDGDLEDTVPVVVDVRDGSTRLLDVAVGHLTDQPANERGVALSVIERSQDQDLNGDGDRNDVVVHFYDFESDTLSNTALASFGVDVGRELVALLATESGNANAEYNGDGDSLDHVLHFLDLDSGPINPINSILHHIYKS